MVYEKTYSLNERVLPLREDTVQGMIKHSVALANSVLEAKADDGKVRFLELLGIAPHLMRVFQTMMGASLDGSPTVKLANWDELVNMVKNEATHLNHAEAQQVIELLSDIALNVHDFMELVKQKDGNGNV